MADLPEQAAAGALAGLREVARAGSKSSLVGPNGPLHALAILLLFTSGKERKAAREQRDECHRLLTQVLDAGDESHVMAMLRGMAAINSPCKGLLDRICSYLEGRDAGVRLPLLRALAARLLQLEPWPMAPPAGVQLPSGRRKDEEDDEEEDRKEAEKKKRGGGGGGGCGGGGGATKKQRGAGTPLAGNKDKGAAPPASQPATTRAKARQATQLEAFLTALFDPVALAAIQALEDTACS